MKKEVENKLVVALFVLVLIIFSFALKDTKKLYPAYTLKEPAKAHLVGRNTTPASELR